MLMGSWDPAQRRRWCVDDAVGFGAGAGCTRHGPGRVSIGSTVVTHTLSGQALTSHCDGNRHGSRHARWDEGGRSLVRPRCRESPGLSTRLDPRVMSCPIMPEKGVTRIQPPRALIPAWRLSEKCARI